MKSIITKYIGYGAGKPSRIVARAYRNRVVVSFHDETYSIEPHLNAAITLIHKYDMAPVMLAKGGYGSDVIFVMLAPCPSLIEAAKKYNEEFFGLNDLIYVPKPNCVTQ